MIRIVISVIGLLLLAGCVSNQAVRTVQAGDDDKSCEALKAEIGDLGVKFEDAKDDSGVTGKNVGLALLFWPGIIVNEVRANKNQDSIDDRTAHLSSIYNQKCLSDSPIIKEGSDEAGSSSLSDRLSELKELHEQGLIDDKEYEAARQRALKEL